MGFAGIGGHDVVLRLCGRASSTGSGAVSFEVIFEEKAISNAAEFLADDRDGV